MLNTLVPLLSLLASGVLLWLGHGLLLTYLPIGGGSLGFSEWEIGLTGSFYFLGFVSGCMATPYILHRVGHIRSFAVLASIYAVITLVLGFIPSLFGWLVLRFVIGASIAGLYMIFESWLSERSHFSNRGSVLAVYSMLNLSMIAAGQQLLHLPVTDPGQYYLVAAILLILSVIPVSLTQTMAPTLLKRTKISLLKVWRYSHIALLGAVVSGLITGGYWAMAPIYGDAIGLDASQIAWFMSASVMGGAIFQYPLGRVSDYIDRRIVLQCVAIFATLVCLLLYYASTEKSPSKIILLAFFWGGTCLTIYAICLAHASDVAQACDFIEISSSMLITLGISSAIGAMLGSVCMKLLGPAGLYAYMALFLLVFALIVQVRRRTHPRFRDMSTHENFQPLPGMTTPMVYELDPRHDEQEEIKK
ncbi:MAG: MFS transporter [Pseudomonadales bacterium]